MSEGNSVGHIGGVVRWLLLLLVPGVAFATLISLPQPIAVGALPTATTVESAVLAFGRVVGLVLCGWLLASHLLYTLAVVTSTRWLAEALRPVTLPLVRRIAAGLATVTISFNTVSAVAQTTTEPPIVAVDTSTLRTEATPTPNLQPIVEVEAEEPCLAEELTGSSYSAPLTWLVRPGDHLWKIAAEHLTIVLERTPTRDEHARYWAEVIDTARPTIRSGDPDLIYPGEEIPLPPTLDAGVRP